MYMRELTRRVLTGVGQAVVRTEAGLVRGAVVEDGYVFRGIPYAEAARFQAPRPPKPWHGVRSALCFGASAPELNTPIAADADRVPRYYFPQGEACLTLNIWTQSTLPDAARPVIVSLYGNDWASGSSNELWASDGEELSAFGNIVFVSVNHRLGPLGFLDLSKFGERYRSSANTGLLDLVEALGWIRRNIAAFGGDPDNVTVLGLAGGADKVVALLQCPAADGLFHRAVLQGSSLAPLKQPAEAGKEIAELTLQELHIEMENVSQIEEISLYDLHTAVSRAVCDWSETHNAESYQWGPLADGQIYLGHPLCVGFRAQSLQIPLMIGSTFSEHQSSRRHLENAVEEIQELFSTVYPDKAKEDVFFLDSAVRPQLLHFAQQRVAAGGTAIYLWLFTLESAWNGKTTAWHNADVPYMLHNAQYIEAAYLPTVSEALQERMAGALVRFAECGDPNHDTLPNWPCIDGNRVPTMHFDRICSVCSISDKALLQKLLAAASSRRTRFHE